MLQRQCLCGFQVLSAHEMSITPIFLNNKTSGSRHDDDSRSFCALFVPYLRFNGWDAEGSLRPIAEAGNDANRIRSDEGDGKK